MNKNNLKTFNFLVLCIVLLGVTSALQNIHITFAPFPKKKPEPVVVEKPKLTYVPQFVLISFDGSRANDLWKDLRDFKMALKAEGKKLNYTFFINTAYFLTPETRNFYIPPQNPVGHTTIGIATNAEDIRARILEINAAIQGGDEIEPHTTGHHSGRTWSKEEWEQEMASFDAILFGVDKLYPNANLPKVNLKQEDLIGFRAPYLDTSAGLYEMLHANPRYKYDTSGVSEGTEWPVKDSSGLWRIPLGTLYVGPNRIPILAMDYNLYVHDSNAADALTRGTAAWQKAHDEMLQAWLDYFNHNYTSNRAPVLVGYHFGQWNDGLYWDVMKEFAREVCGKPEVDCGTFRELVSYMDEYGVPNKQ
jgi:hypothetical protein